MNLTASIIPRSDQLNADDLIAGPRTIKITAVESGSAEQPVCIQYVGGTGRPYKPSKSMRRVLVTLWGTDGNAYVGRSITLYRDPNVKFGGDPVGGIKISHASDIAEPMNLLLTETRGKRKPHRVEPLVEETARPMDELVAAGDIMAAQGVEQLSNWWQNSLNKKERVLLKDKIGPWKTTAGSTAYVDAAKKEKP